MDNNYFKDQEINIIEKYMKECNASVLTIMFTDIKGFTQMTEEKGDVYSNKIRNTHDEIMYEIIENGGSGKIVKHIGDSVMAIFSSPSIAVEKACAIQNRFNSIQGSELGDLSLRIGLHMGEISVDEKVYFDIFGTHVNKAARIESLADGGHIYLSHTVLDSAKGWISDHQSIKWVNHGYYALKGIKEATEIYEVYNKDIIVPKKPKVKEIKSGKKTRAIISTVAILAILMLFLSQKDNIFVGKGALTIKTQIPAKVYLDDNYIGDTDSTKGLNEEKIKSGLHTIKLDFGIREIDSIVTIVRNSEKIVDNKWIPKDLDVKFRAKKNGNIYIDGEFIYEISAYERGVVEKVKEGNHKLLFKSGGTTIEKIVEIKPGVENILFLGNVESDVKNKDMIKVKLESKSIYVGKYEVTQEEFKRVMLYNTSEKRPGVGDELPVNGLSWNEAVEYCNRRSELEGYEPVYKMKKLETLDENVIKSYKVSWNSDKKGYRLPTFKEWVEISADEIDYSGDDIKKSAWIRANADYIVQKGGLKKPNKYGIYDMVGNLWEFCYDKKNKHKEYRVIAGGSVYNNRSYFEKDLKSGYLPEYGVQYGGIRVVRDI